jgi:hypothetical protein
MRFRGYRLALLVVLAVAAAGGSSARAGGGSFDATTDEDDTRGTLFGFVKDRSGDPVDDAKVTVTMNKLNASLVLRSDPQGHYTAKMFYKNFGPEDITLACAKDGYRQVTTVSRPPLAAGAPVEIDCVLDHP